MAADAVIAKVAADITEMKADLAEGLKEFRAFGQKIPATIPKDPFKDIKAAALDFGKILAVATPFVVATKEAAGYEKALRDLNKITQLGEAELTAYGEKLRTLSIELETNTDQTQNAEAAYQVASAGFKSAADNADVLNASLILATAGNEDAAASAEFLAGQLQAYGASANQAGRFSDVLFTTVKNGITTIPQLASSLGNVSGNAAQAGISFEELNAIMATATTRGLKTTTTVDGLRGAIFGLQAPSKQGQKELARLGLTVNEQTLRNKGFIRTVQEIAEANGNSAASFKKILGPGVAVTLVQKLISDGGELATQNLNDMAKAAGETGRALEEHNKTAIASYDAFLVALKASGTAVGQLFLPAVTAGLNKVTKLVQAFATAPPGFIKAATAIAGVGAAALILDKSLKLLVLTTGAVKSSVVALGARVKALGPIFVKTGALAKAGMAAVSAGALAAAAGVLAAGLALHEWTQIVKENTAASESLLKSYEKAGKGARILRESVGKTTDELEKQGITAADLTLAIEANIAKAEQARANNNQSLLKKLREENADLRKTKNELAKREGDQRKVSKSVDNFRIKQIQLEGEAEVKTSSKVKAQKEKDRKELLAVERSRIQVLKKERKLSADEEIKALENVLKKFELNKAEELRIEEEIAALVGGKKKKAEDDARKAAEEAKKEKADSLTIQIQNLETEKELAKNAQERLDIEKQIIELEKQAALAADEKGKNKAEILKAARLEKELAEQTASKEQKAEDKKASDQKKKDAAEEAKKAKELVDLKVEGLKLDLEAAKTSKDKLRIQEQILQLEAASELAKTTDPAARAQIEKNLQAELKAARTEAREEEKKRHNEAMGNLEAEKRKAIQLKNQFGGGILSLDEFVTQQNEALGFGTSARRRPKKEAAASSSSALPGLPTTSSPSTSPFKPLPSTPSSGGTEQAAGGAGSPIVERLDKIDATIKQAVTALMGGKTGSTRAPAQPMGTPYQFETNGAFA